MTHPLNFVPPGLHADFTRRRVLALSWSALLGGAALPGHAATGAGADGGRFVLVFLRGAADGLSMLVPHSDPQYAQLRRATAVGAPDGSHQTALALDDRFGLHPALAPLLPLWKQGVFGFVPTTGLPKPVRSHFEAQRQWEAGDPQNLRLTQGWLNGWAQQLAQADAKSGPHATALGVGESNPDILHGPAQVSLVPGGDGALAEGALGREGIRRALTDLYAADPRLAKPFAQATESRLGTARVLREAQAEREAAAQAQTKAGAAMASTSTGAENAGGSMAGPLQAEMQKADNGARLPGGLALDARHLGALMKRDPRLRVGFLSAGGWDTHANQGGASGNLANNLNKLAQGLVELQRHFNRRNDVIVVASEFGRTCAENGTRGTDHGHGNAMLLMGQRVNGGRWHGRWEGLAADQLNEQRDLPVFHDFRAVVSLLLRGTQGASDAQLAAMFANNPFAGSALTSGDNRLLKDLVRA